MKSFAVSILIFGVSFFLVTVSNAAEKAWTAGALPVADSMNEVSTTSTIKKIDDSVCELSYSFANKMSNGAYAQFPMQTKKVFAKVNVPIRTEGEATQVELWLETDKGWQFQLAFEVKSKDWYNFQAPIVKTTSDKVKSLRLIVQNKNNPAKGAVFLKAPAFWNELTLDKKVTKELEKIDSERLKKDSEKKTK